MGHVHWKNVSCFEAVMMTRYRAPKYNDIVRMSDGVVQIHKLVKTVGKCFQGVKMSSLIQNEKCANIRRIILQMPWTIIALFHDCFVLIVGTIGYF